MEVPPRRALRAVLLVAAIACDSPVSPLPSGAIAFEPDRGLWRQWWAQVETCSGRRGRFESVAWYVVPDVDFFLWRGQEVRGLWTSNGNRIILAERATTAGPVVRHEMLHAILRVDGHPQEFFLGRCRGVVD